MKIALIAEHRGPPSWPAAGAYPAGPAAGALALARALAARGHQVTVYSRRDAPALPGRSVLCPGADAVYLTAGPQEWLPDDALLPHIPAFARQLGERWQRRAPDVVHAYSWANSLAALAGVRDLGIPVAATLHEPTASEPARSRLEAAIARGAGAVLAGTSDERSELGRLVIPQSSLKVVPPGVDTSTFQPSGPAAPRDGRPRLLMVAPPSGRQGPAAAARALADVPDAELLLAGGPPADQLAGDPGYRALTALSRELGIRDRLHCTGEVSQATMPALMRSADALVNLTTSEPFATVTLEAMACGLPVIGCDAGINSDALIDGITGYLVPRAEPALLAARIRRLLASRMLHEGFGIAAASRAHERYSWTRISKETIAVYETLLSRLPAAA